MTNNDYLNLNKDLRFSPTEILNLNKYLKADFGKNDYAELRTNPNVFTQVDGFLNNYQFDKDLTLALRNDFNADEIAPDSWGYPAHHPVTQAFINFNPFIWKAFIASNNFSTIGFHNYIRGVGTSDGYGKSIGAIGEGIFAKRLSDDAGFTTFISQGSNKGGYQHDILQRTACFRIKIGSTESTFVLKVNYTDQDGERRSSDIWTFGKDGKFSIGKISYEVKTVDEATNPYWIKKSLLDGVDQVKKRASIDGIDAGVLVFDYNAFQVIKDDPDVIAAIADLNSQKNSDNQQKAFIRLESGLRAEADRAYYALRDLTINLQP